MNPVGSSIPSAPNYFCKREVCEIIKEGHVGKLKSAFIDPCLLNEMLLVALDQERANLDICKILLERGASPDAESKRTNNWRAVHYAAKSGSLELLELLLDQGASIQRTGSKQTLLHAAVIADVPKIAMIKKILTLGVDINSIDVNYQTALHWAAYKDTEARREAIVCLLKEGACIDIKDEEKCTPIDIAKFYVGEYYADWLSGKPNFETL